MTRPFDGAITTFFEETVPQNVRDAIENAGKDDILNPSYPHKKQMKSKHYDNEMDKLQIELVKMQAWARDTGQRIAIVFEGRDAAGKGGTISRFRTNLNPRVANVVALSKPTETEASQWYFQRYIQHLPSGGQITFFDRSWYNRAVVEHVFGFCEVRERTTFFKQVNDFEKMVTGDGVTLFKFWLNVGRAEQLRRMLKRESDPLKQWKLSWIDVEGLGKWDAYTKAIAETFDTSHSHHAPWTVVRTDDKKRARLNAIRAVLNELSYTGKDVHNIGVIDQKVLGGPDIWNA